MRIHRGWNGLVRRRITRAAGRTRGVVSSDSHLWLVLGFQVAAGISPVCECPSGSAADEARPIGVGGIYRVRRVSCAGPRNRHDLAVLGGLLSVAMSSPCNGGEAGIARGATAVFVIVLRRVNAKWNTLDLVFLSDRRLRARRPSSRSAS